MKANKKWLSVALAAAISTSLLAGCTSSSEEADSPASTNAQSAEEAAALVAKGKYDTPVTLTRVVNNTQEKFINGEDWDNNIFTKWAKEKLGIELKTLWVVDNVNNAYTNKLNLSLSSGEDLPDLVPIRDNPNYLNTLLDSDQFMTVDDLFEKYASPKWKELAKKYPEMWYGVTREDGKAYGVPVFDYTLNVEPVLWIRQDWLDKLHLQAPTTVEELDKVMDAFVNQDPDGDGKKDTYGLAVTLRDNLNTWMSDLSWIFGAYGTAPRQWNKSADGKSLEWGSTQEGTKQALAKLNEWMTKGYISKEAGTWDESKASESFTKGEAGIIAGPHWMPDWPLPDLAKNVKGAKYKAYSVPAGPDGKKGVRGGPINSMVNGYILINKKAAHPEAYFIMYNYLLEHFANPEIGGEFEYGFAEGYDYRMVNGKPSKDNSDDKLVKPERYGVTWEGARQPDLMIDTLAKLAAGQPPVTPFEKQTKEYRKQEEIDAAGIVMGYEKNGQRYPDYFASAYTDAMNQKMELLRQLEVEAFTKIIYGNAPIDSYEDFVKEWKASGGDEVTADVNKWFATVNK
ncbi:extracellular solute-binding protein family 1 [Paenibacillus curdlanolyticus YK9]|uniref:Extracellular solute-binding protein family 1 n=1 Tax=Paenibacillus curdlanolyticus YK9 TaxID=717606 RepID=E0I9N0_9BACL|nr:extracellular solute-binding protein [Paenibacillus curdlanolyticus]EFM11114.1 extracellular solute-binding protein family 1 [Paenibacillus curdlanolyticus YK9]